MSFLLITLKIIVLAPRMAALAVLLAGFVVVVPGGELDAGPGFLVLLAAELVVAFLLAFLLWNVRFSNRRYDAIDNIRTRLKQAGLEVSDDFLGVASKNPRVGVTARGKGHIIHAESVSELRAWQKAYAHAQALGLVESPAEILKASDANASSQHIIPAKDVDPITDLPHDTSRVQQPD